MKHWPKSDLLAETVDGRFRRLVVRARRLRSGALSFAPGDVVEEHLHPGSDEIFFIISGEGTISSAEESCAISAGDLVFIPAGEAHSIVAGEANDPLVMLAVVAPDLGDDSVYTGRSLPIG